MSNPKARILRSSAQGVRPTPGAFRAGQAYINYADNQFGVIDVAEAPQDLIAVRYFSDVSVYVINDVVLNALDGVLYQCIVNNGPGPFTATDWTTAIDSFEKRLKGYNTDGTHADFAGDLDSLLFNADHAVTASSISNHPVDFVDQGLLLTNMFSTSAFGVQVLTGMSGAAKNKIWMRQRDASIWGPWVLAVDPTLPPVPVGSVTMFAGETVPDKYLACNGNSVSRTTYADLFAVLGVIYGDGDGSTTFELPDYRGRFIRGHDQGAGRDPDRNSRSNRGDGVGGDNVGTIQGDQYKSHTHALGAVGDHVHDTNIAQTSSSTGSGGASGDPGSGNGPNTDPAGAHNHSITSAGGNETRPDNIYANFIIFSGVV